MQREYDWASRQYLPQSVSSRVCRKSGAYDTVPKRNAKHAQRACIDLLVHCVPVGHQKNTLCARCRLSCTTNSHLTVPHKSLQSALVQHTHAFAPPLSHRARGPLAHTSNFQSSRRGCLYFRRYSGDDFALRLSRVRCCGALHSLWRRTTAAILLYALSRVPAHELNIVMPTNRAPLLFRLALLTLVALCAAQKKRCVSLFNTRPDLFDVCLKKECLLFRTEVPVRFLSSALPAAIPR